MTSAQETGSQAPPGGAASAGRRLRLDPRYVAPILVTLVLVAGWSAGAVLESPGKTALAIVAAIAADALIGRAYYGKWPHLASAYVTGISVGILIRSPHLWWPYAMCSVLSILSKYVLRIRDRHIWNPSNFGISAMLLLGSQAVAPLSIQFGNDWRPLVVIWLLGSFIIGKLRRFHISATYVLSFLFFAWIQSLRLGGHFLAEIAPITSPPYQLFIFFMITDPRTTVRDRRGQMATAFFVAFAEFLFRMAGNVHAPYYALFTVGPTANLIEMFAAKRKQPAPAAAG